MLHLNKVTLRFADRVLLNEVSLMMHKRDRAGLVGKNGAGKSTLFKIISKQASPDEGSIQSSKHYTIGYLKQDLIFDANRTVLEEAKTSFSEINDTEQRLVEVNEELAARTDYETADYLELIEELSDLNARLSILSADKLEENCVKILKGLGFKEEELSKKVVQFSGGWQMRIEIAKLLLIQPDLLLLDEPTNHLDIESIIWLENYLQSYPGNVLIISHDKQFLDNTCTKIYELELGKLSEYSGNYSKYIVEKEANQEILLNSYANQQKAIADKEKIIAKFMAKATKTSMAQSMQKQLEKMEKIEIPDADTKQMKVRFPQAARPGDIVLDVKDVKKSFGEKHVLKGISFILERGDKIAFVGKNGMGKTTMAKIIVSGLQADSGVVKNGANVQLGYYAQNQAESLDAKKTVLQTLEDIAPYEQRPYVRSILGSFLFSGEDVDKKVSVLSGGERARLAMACMILNPANLIIMDEPTNHLDITSKDVLKQALMDYEGSLIIVSHDREFLKGLSHKVFEFVDGGIKEYLGDINYFLEKKKMTDTRQIETTKESNSENNQKQVSNFDREEIKKAKRKIQYLERDIESLEVEIANLLEKLNDVDFYKSDAFQKVNKDLKDKQEMLATKSIEWENLVMEYDL